MNHFFAFESHDPSSEESRHMTIHFLGKEEKEMPAINFPFGLVGVFDKPLQLAHALAWHVELFEKKEAIEALAKILGEKKPFLPHITISRKEKELLFTSLPVLFTHFHLYESLGHSQYRPLKTIALPLAFEEIEHTADIAFRIRGGTFWQLYLHAFIALSFRFSPLISYLRRVEPSSLEEVIGLLNAAICEADTHCFCPFKAVSLHGVHQDGIWEMIVDV